MADLTPTPQQFVHDLYPDGMPHGVRERLVAAVRARDEAIRQQERERAGMPWCIDTGTQAIQGACPVHGGDACLYMVAGLLDKLHAAESERDAALAEHEARKTGKP